MEEDAARDAENQSEEAPFILDVVVERQSSVPLHRQISEPLERLIHSGGLPSGALIEDEVSMAKRLQVSRPTTRRALQDLVSRGLVTRRRGVGTRVNPSQIHRPAGLTSLRDDLRKAGFETHTEVLSYRVCLAGPTEAARLHCEEGIELVLVERLRSSNGAPLAILVNLLPGDIAPTLTDLSTRGLYECLRERGVVLVTAQQKVSARNASPREAELLGVSEGAAVLTMRSTVYDQAGTVVEFADHVYNPELYALSFTSVAE